MKKEEMESFVENIQNKLGKESASVIMDDLGLLITDNANMNKKIESNQVEIEKQKSLNDKLIATNSSLLQQVGMDMNNSQDFNSSFGSSPKFETKKDIPTTKSYSFKDCFDEKGNFKK